jgi:hypothetical protein
VLGTRTPEAEAQLRFSEIAFDASLLPGLVREAQRIAEEG